MKIQFSNIEQNSKFKYSKEARNLIREIIESENKRLGIIHIIFTDNQKIFEINSRFLGHHHFTDVITFDESVKEMLSGEIYISMDQVRTNAQQFKVRELEELFRVLIHGILHLAGYSDKNEEEKRNMRLKEDAYLCEARRWIDLENNEALL